MNADVERAVESLDQSLEGLHPAEAHWSAIKQALRDQEAEIARLSGINVRLCADFNAQNLHGATLDDRVRKAEARAEKAEALLREIDRNGVLSIRLKDLITAHLGAEQ